MNTHIIAYEGTNVSLALMQPMYEPEYISWPNRRVDVSGTLQRPPYFPEHFREWLEVLRKSKGKDEVFAVLAHGGRRNRRAYRYLGHMGIHGASWPGGFAATGSILGAKDARGKGYGTEAKLLIQHHAFNVMGLRKLMSEVKSFNTNSLGHLLKCGYQIIGRRKAHHFHEGAFADELILECFREDWESIWDTYCASGVLPRLTDAQREVVRKQANQE